MLLTKIITLNVTSHFGLSKDNPDDEDAMVKIIPLEWLPTEKTMAMHAAFKDEVEVDASGKPVLDEEGHPRFKANSDEESALRQMIRAVAPAVKWWNFKTEAGDEIPLPKDAVNDDLAFAVIWGNVPMAVLSFIFDSMSVTAEVPQTT